MSKFTDISAQLQITPKRWLVTGAAGFIGSHLCEKLLLLNQDVIGLDNLSTGSMENIDELRQTVAPKSKGKFSES